MLVLHNIDDQLGRARKDDHLVTCLPGAPPGFNCDDLNPVLLQKDFLFDFFTRSIGRRREHASFVINTFEDLEHEILEHLRKHHTNVYSVGPLLPPSYLSGSYHDDDGSAAIWPEEQSCLQWLDQQQPASVLFVSFGSLVALSPNEVEEIACGLEANPQSILWVARSDDKHEKSPNVPPEDFLERIVEFPDGTRFERCKQSSEHGIHLGTT